MNERRSRFLVAACAVLIAAMLAQPYVSDHIGQFILLAVWGLLSMGGMVAWVAAWARANRRNPEILSGWWAKTKLVVWTGVLLVICFAVAFAIGHFG
ncbi:hypothetical protein [Spirillospora sp. CA-128828]|uniref:hypothetical protein n=1 Tax=Spirillospora sp. CA-128828 TaxID=3240033 RepID=UPI003D8A3D0E